MRIVQAPLFRDPIHDGAADPALIYNVGEGKWWILYTNRRADSDGPGVAWVHGTDIGAASLEPNGEWLYRGIIELPAIEPGRNTFWAPEVLRHEGRYHMYVSYVSGVPTSWKFPRHIIHMSSSNLWDWNYESTLGLSSDKVIDACVFRIPAGTWRMWYKDEANGSHTWAADSADLHSWKVAGPVIEGGPHEGPNVFELGGFFWMIVDFWKGQGVYRSKDCLAWERRADILSKPGNRPDDGAYANHADVLTRGDEAYIFYFTHPGRRPGDPKGIEENVYSRRRSSIQAARLRVEDGELLCDRDEAFELDLSK